MATEIGRNLKEIDNKVKTLNKSLKEFGDTTKELDKSLKLDSKNLDAAAKKMVTLQSAVVTATQKVTLLRQKQLQAKDAFKKGDVSAAEYKKIELSVLRAENEVTRLSKEIRINVKCWGERNIIESTTFVTERDGVKGYLF